MQDLKKASLFQKYLSNASIFQNPIHAVILLILPTTFYQTDCKTMNCNKVIFKNINPFMSIEDQLKVSSGSKKYIPLIRNPIGTAC